MTVYDMKSGASAPKRSGEGMQAAGNIGGERPT
jgi:hypothetical protein